MAASDTLKIVLGCFVAGFLLFFFVRRLFVNSEDRNVATYAALQSPSVRNAANAFDRRVALATRAAAEGSVACMGCGFDNPRQCPSCVLCGVALPTKGSGVKWMKQKPRPSGSENVGVESARQRRIRRRREWSRQVGTDGKITWQYDCTLRGTSKAATPAYVMVPSVKEDDSPSHDNLRTPNPIEIIVDDRSPDAMSTTASVARTLESDMRKYTVSSLTPGEAVGMPGIQESVRTAQLDFPSKLAHYIKRVAEQFREATQEGNANEAPIARFHIIRESLVSESIEALALLTPSESRGAIRVDFTGEQGIDAGGVYREWVQLLNQAMVTPETGIFTCVNAQDQVFYLNPQAKEVLGEDYLAHFLAAGRLLGRALLEGNATGFHLALPLLKIILGLPVGFNDLEYYDPDVHKNLKWLLDNDGVDALCLDFTVTETLPSGKTKTVELMEGGSEVDVTDANKREFVDRKLKYLLFESVSSQLCAFVQGIYEVVPLELLMVFDAEELDFVLSGSNEIDVDDWETHTVCYSDPNQGRHRALNLNLLPCYGNFWKAVRELSIDERRRLLQFTTGSTRPPPGGFGSLTSYDGRLSLFTLRGVPTQLTRGYLQSHACFNRLDLPMHSGYVAMRDAVHAAISGDTNGFTID